MATEKIQRILNHGQDLGNLNALQQSRNSSLITSVTKEESSAKDLEESSTCDGSSWGSVQEDRKTLTSPGRHKSEIDHISQNNDPNLGLAITFDSEEADTEISPLCNGSIAAQSSYHESSRASSGRSCLVVDEAANLSSALVRDSYVTGTDVADGSGNEGSWRSSVKSAVSFVSPQSGSKSMLDASGNVSAGVAVGGAAGPAEMIDSWRSEGDDVNTDRMGEEVLDAASDGFDGSTGSGGRDDALSGSLSTEQRCHGSFSGCHSFRSDHGWPFNCMPMLWLQFCRD
jgi:hypothetical protein